MRHAPIEPLLFKENRQRLGKLLEPQSLAVVNANDILPTNADGTFIIHPNADLFYLTGIEQEESILVLFPDAPDPKHREILFLREPSEHLRIWEWVGQGRASNGWCRATCQLIRVARKDIQ